MAIKAARNLRRDDVLAGGGTITHIFDNIPGVVTVEVDYTVLVGSWDPGDPVQIMDREGQDA